MTKATSPQIDTRPKLQLSNGYYAEFDQFARILSATTALRHFGRIPSAEIVGRAGLADVQVKNLGSLMVGMGLLYAITYRPTELGEVIAACDPFFDDLGTLWILHYNVASDPRHIVWNRIANSVVPSQRRITSESCRAVFEDLRASVSEASFKKHVPKEIRTVLNAYTQQQFSRLVYLRADGSGFVPGYREQVPPLVLAASIARFRDRHRPGHTAITVEDLLTCPNSPGVILGLGEDRMRPLLEALRHEPGISVESRADLDQVRLVDSTPDHEWMGRYYERR